MSSYSCNIRNLTELRTFIHTKLCEQEHLEPGVFPMTERILTRGGKPCGVYFSLHGPRSVRLTAIWENEMNTILFYGSTGQRFHKLKLVTTPEMADCRAMAAQ